MSINSSTSNVSDIPKASDYVAKIKSLQDQGVVFKIRDDGFILWHTLKIESIKTLELNRLMLKYLMEDKTRIQTVISRSEINSPNDPREIKMREGLQKILKAMNFAYGKICTNNTYFNKQGMKHLAELEKFKNIVKDNVSEELFLVWSNKAKL